MNIQISDWTEFKSVLNQRNLWLQYTEFFSYYLVFMVDSLVIYSINISKTNPRNEEQVDFEDNYKADANRPLVFSPSSKQTDFVGKQIEIAPGNSTGTCYWEYPDKDVVWIRRAMPIAIDAVWGDYIEFTVIMEQEGEEVELAKYGSTIYLYGNIPRDVWFDGFGLGPIPQGCKIKCTYTAADTNGRKFIIYADFQI